MPWAAEVGGSKQENASNDRFLEPSESTSPVLSLYGSCTNCGSPTCSLRFVYPVQRDVVLKSTCFRCGPLLLTAFGCFHDCFYSSLASKDSEALEG